MKAKPVNVILYPVPKNEAKYSRMDQVNLWKTAFKRFEGVWPA